eukprot:5087877-Alexandrium_andersonii.AAC.1
MAGPYVAGRSAPVPPLVEAATGLRAVLMTASLLAFFDVWRGAVGGRHIVLPPPEWPHELPQCGDDFFVVSIPIRARDLGCGKAEGLLREFNMALRCWSATGCGIRWNRIKQAAVCASGPASLHLLVVADDLRVAAASDPRTPDAAATRR